MWRQILDAQQARLKDLYLRFWSECSYPFVDADSPKPRGEWIRNGLGEMGLTRDRATFRFYRQDVRFEEVIAPKRWTTTAHDLTGQREQSVLRDQETAPVNFRRCALNLFLPTLDDRLTTLEGAESVRGISSLRVAQGDSVYWLAKEVGAAVRQEQFAGMDLLRMRVDFFDHFEMDSGLFFPQTIERRLFLSGNQMVRLERVDILSWGVGGATAKLLATGDLETSHA